MHEGRAFAGREFNTERYVSSGFVIIRGESAEVEEIWVGKVLSLSRFSVKGDEESVELTFVQYMEYESLSDAVNETLGRKRLQCGRQRMIGKKRVK